MRPLVSRIHVTYIAYTPTGRLCERILYICPVQGWVRMGFDYCADLPDPAGLVVGEGKRMRHVKVRSLEEAGAAELQRLTAAAWQARLRALTR